MQSFRAKQGHKVLKEINNLNNQIKIKMIKIESVT